jgi:hypothetical protein
MDNVFSTADRIFAALRPSMKRVPGHNGIHAKGDPKFQLENVDCLIHNYSCRHEHPQTGMRMLPHTHSRHIIRETALHLGRAT